VKLPNGKLAIVDIKELQDYCLSLQHPRGRHKARVFASAGIESQDAEELRAALFDAANSGDATPGAPSPYGKRYTVDFELERPERRIRIRSTWIIRDGENLPRLTSCYVL
jgi:hypothetical protein